MMVTAGWQQVLNVTAIARGRLLARASRGGEFLRANRAQGRCGLGGRNVDAGGRGEQPSTEDDAAEREPGPAEREAADHIREPVKVEQDAARCDGDRERDRRRDDDLTRPPWKVAPDNQSSGGVERGRRRGVSARERGAERCRRRVERGPNTADEILDSEHGRLHADEHREQEEKRPAVSPPDDLERDERKRQDDHDLEPSQLGDRVQPFGGRGAAMVVSPRGDNVVEVLYVRNPTNQKGQNAEGQAAEKRDRQRECE